MKIRFTDHAKLRCAQRNISEKWLEARLQTVPFTPSPRNHEMLLDKTNVFVVFHDGSTIRNVITVYLSIELKIEPKQDVSGHLKDSRVRDMLHKAVGKSKRRGRGKGGRKWR